MFKMTVKVNVDRRKLTSKVKPKAMDLADDIANEVLNLAKIYVPFDESVVKRSGVVVKKGNLRSVVFKDDRSLLVHETPGDYSITGRPRFLSTALREVKARRGIR